MRQKQHNLEDIRKYLTYIPPIFIFVLTLLSIFVSIIVNDFQKEAAIKLMTQKYELNSRFQSKQALDLFIQDVNRYIQNALSHEENNLKYSLFETMGYLKAHEIGDITSYIKQQESKSGVRFVLFDSKNYEVLYGDNSVTYLQNLIFGNKSDCEIEKRNVLMYIYSQGDRNLQYWKDDQKKTIRLSFFSRIANTDLFLGAFSTVDSLRRVTKNSIIEHINLKNKDRDFKFWLYDYLTNEFYNFDEKEKTTHFYELDSKFLQNEIIQAYNDVNYKNNILSNKVYDFAKFHFLVVVEPQRVDVYKDIKEKKEIIAHELDAIVQNQIFLISFVCFVLLLSSLLFSKFITHIFTRYNNEQKKQNELLEEWKERYKLAIIASNDGFWDINLDTWDIYFSTRWHEMYGYQKGDVNNFRDWLSLVHNEDRPIVKTLFDEHLEGKSEHFISEYRIKTKANMYKWVLARGKVFWEQRRMLMMSMDIDKPKKMQNELEEAERLVEDGRIVIFRWSKDERLSVEYVSKSIRNYGYEQESIHNSSYFDIVYPEDRELLKESIAQAIQEDKTFFFSSYRIVDGDGEIKWIFSRAIIVKDHFSNVHHFYGYIHDITKIKLSEVELKQRVADEVEKNIQKDRLLIQQSKLASMGEMLGSIAHQWRQPLNNVSLILHFIKDNFGNKSFSKEKLEGFVKRAKEQIDYMSDTIDDFKNFFRPSKAKKPFVISEAIKSALSIIGVQLHSSDINISLKLQDLVVDGYENEFKQAILNILNNAKDAILIKKQSVDFTPKIEVVTNILENRCSISIFNNGGNISEEVKQKMFEPYFTTKFENKGTGIGLYMCKTIIEGSMHGEIKVENKKDGIVFEILLPICYNDNNNATKEIS